MSIADKKYKELIKEIAINGVWDKGDNTLPRTRYSDGEVAYSKSVFGVQVKFEQGEIPLLTSKKVFTTTAINEMICIWIKRTNIVKDFQDMKVNVWNEWEMSDGSLGQSYAYQLSKVNNQGRNQVDQLLHDIKHSPLSRRLMTCYWDFENAHNKALQECAWFTQWGVRNGYLDLLLGQRSGDLGLGICFNWFQYYVLQMLISRVSGLKVGTFTHQIGNLHYYDRHEDVLLEQLNLPEYEQPNIYIKDAVNDFYQFVADDVVIENYKHGKYLPMEVAI